MNFVRRWTALKRGMGQHCHTKWFRHLLHAVMIVMLILSYALAGFMWSQSVVPALTEKVEALEAKVNECNGFLNGNVKMLDANSGEIYNVVKTEVKLIEGINQGETK